MSKLTGLASGAAALVLTLLLAATLGLGALAASASPGYSGGPLGGTGSFTDSIGPVELPGANPRTPAEAIAYARAATLGPTQWYRLCLAFTARAYGWNHSGSPTSNDHWRSMPAAYRRVGDRQPPPGALLYWDTGQPAGHVALYVGNGLIATNDILRHGGIDIVPADLIEQRWGATYLGWTPPYYPNAS